MNKIVREHYPASNLPDDLRQGLDANARVRVVIEEEAGIEHEWPLDLDFAPLLETATPLSAAEMLESIRLYKATHPPLSDPEEPVRRIRALRDEWDDE